MHKIAVIIPTYNPGSYVDSMIDALLNQDIELSKVIIVDSSSSDGSIELWRKAGFNVITINQADFDHGRSRNLGAQAAVECNVLIFMTQDAIPQESGTLRALVEPILNQQADALYARQVARPDASYVEKLTRQYNYPTLYDREFILKDKAVENNGARTYFFSNVCSAYNAKIFRAIGGFEEGVILNEDVIICKKMMDEGYRVGYNSRSVVVHSHEYTMKKDLARSFDIGVSHSDIELLKNLNSEGEGIKYVIFVLKSLLKYRRILIPKFIMHSVVRYLGYYLGKNHHFIGESKSRKLSMNKGYWKREEKSY